MATKTFDWKVRSEWDEAIFEQASSARYGRRPSPRDEEQDRRARVGAFAVASVAREDEHAAFGSVSVEGIVADLERVLGALRDRQRLDVGGALVAHAANRDPNAFCAGRRICGREEATREPEQANSEVQRGREGVRHSP
jgi:hypothetical protein